MNIGSSLENILGSMCSPNHMVVDLENIEGNIDWDNANKILKDNTERGYQDRSTYLSMLLFGAIFVVAGLYAYFCMPFDSHTFDKRMALIMPVLGAVVIIVGLSLILREIYAKNNIDLLFCGIVVEKTDDVSRDSHGHRSRTGGRVVAYKTDSGWSRVRTINSSGFKGYEVGELMQLMEYRGKVKCVMSKHIYKDYHTFNH